MRRIVVASLVSSILVELLNQLHNPIVISYSILRYVLSIFTVIIKIIIRADNPNFSIRLAIIIVHQVNVCHR